MSLPEIPWHARAEYCVRTSREAKRFGEQRHLTIRQIAALAGEPDAQVLHYGTRIRSFRVALAVARYIDDTTRQMALPL